MTFFIIRRKDGNRVAESSTAKKAIETAVRWSKHMTKAEYYVFESTNDGTIIFRTWEPVTVVNDEGSYYAQDGTLMNNNGTEASLKRRHTKENDT